MTPMLLEDKIILVSGGTRGLGAGIARAAAADGAGAIMITGRDESAGKALAAELGNNGPTSGPTLLILPIRSLRPKA
jgi:NAD(P)-dependent dehydrogenase (short-subunit alcohol dehydrogenase family)